MSFENKYRVHELAKDFKVNGKAVGSKKVMEILTKYAETPSSHMAVLSDRELSIVFDYLTQNNQIKDLEEVFSETYHEPKGGAKPKTAPKEKGQNSAGGTRATGSPAPGTRPALRLPPRAAPGRKRRPSPRNSRARAPRPPRAGNRSLPAVCPRRRWSTPAAAWM